MSRILNLLFLLKFLCFDIINCLNKKPKNNSQEIINNVKNEKNYNATNKRKLQDDSYKAIRIYLDTFFLSNLRISKERFEVFNESLYRAKNALEKLIKIKRGTNEINGNEYNNIIMTQFSLRDYEINRTLNGTNDIGDLIIFAMYEGDDSAFKSCSELPKILKKRQDGRPIIASITINTKFLSQIVDNTEYQKEFYSLNFLHQFTHILGFRKSIFNDIGSPKIKLSKKIINRLDKNNAIKNINKDIITSYSNSIESKLMAFAKKYFNCPTLTEIELEDISEGIGCDDYIHWDARILLGDYMTSLIHLQDQVISEFTLAFLEDTGLYEIINFLVTKSISSIRELK